MRQVSRLTNMWWSVMVECVYACVCFPRPWWGGGETPSIFSKRPTLVCKAYNLSSWRTRLGAPGRTCRTPGTCVSEKAKEGRTSARAEVCWLCPRRPSFTWSVACSFARRRVSARGKRALPRRCARPTLAFRVATYQDQTLQRL